MNDAVNPPLHGRAVVDGSFSLQICFRTEDYSGTGLLKHSYFLTFHSLSPSVSFIDIPTF